MAVQDEDEVEGTDSGEAELSRREVTERAFDSLADGDAGEPPVRPEPVEGETQAQRDERARDESGRFAKAPKDEPKIKAKPRQEAAPAKPQIAPAAREPVAPAPGVQPSAKAPQSWKPAARERFASLPPDIQEEILRVNRETTKVLQENAQLRQSGGAFEAQVRPYEATIRSSGMEPAAYVGSLLQTVHALTYGPPHAQADTLAAVVAQYGAHLLQPDRQEPDGSFTSPLVRALAARLQGRQGAQPAPQGQAQQQQQFRDPRIDQMLAERASQIESSAQERSQAFRASHEFADDVADGVADILDLWAKQGKREVSAADMERAYTIACQSHPDVAPVFEQRRAAELAAKARASTQRSRAAAVSIRSRPAVEAPREKGKLNPREITEQAFDDISGRV
jgi:hypothetical protein